jgi:hypothetical protein
MKKIILFCFLLFIALPASSQGEVVSYRMYITSGGANTSGGFSGNGMGYLTLRGRFNLIIDYNSGSVNLENINISFNKKTSYLDWNALKGTFNFSNLYLSSPNPINDCNNYLSGTFDGNTALLNGGLSDGVIDGFGYDCNFTAVVIPVYQTPDGEIVAWGYNGDGECTLPEPNTSFKAIAAGCGYSLGLKDDGSVLAWGYNVQGECNVPSPNTGFTEIAAGPSHSLGLKDDGSITAWGWNYYGECNVPSPNTGFIAIAAGSWHSLGLKQDGSIVAWGYNWDGQCNVPEPNTGFTAIAAGNRHSLGLKNDGSIVAWGGNALHQCEVPSPNSDFKAIAAGSSHSVGLKQDGSIAAWGYNYYGQCSVPLPNIGFAAIAAGDFHTLGLKYSGAILAFGLNEDGQCVVPQPNINFTAMAAGEYHSLGIKKPNAITVTRCKVTSGERRWQDAFSISGNIAFSQVLDFNNVYEIDVNVISLTDGASVYRETVYSNVTKGRFKYTYKIPSIAGGAITSLVVDSGKKIFSIKAKKVGLKGLTCPLRLELTLVGPVTGEYILSGDAYESIVNGCNTIPVSLMRQYRNTLIVKHTKYRHSSLFGDSLLVKGEIAVENISYSNLVAQDVEIIWGEQFYVIPSGSLIAAKTGHSYKCSKISSTWYDGLITAMINLDKCKFTLKITRAAIDANSGIVPFGIDFTGFNETVYVNID